MKKNAMKKIRYGFILIVGLFFYSMLLSASVRNIYLSSDEGKSRLGIFAKPIKFLAETTTSIYKFIQPDEFLISNADLGDGFSYLNKNDSVPYPNLLVSYKAARFDSRFELLNINTGKSIKEWVPDSKGLYLKAYQEDNPRRPPSKDSDLYFMHPLMTKDSSLIFNSQLTSLLAKINAENELMWLKNDRIYHHTIESDSEGNIYVCTQPFISGKFDFLPGSFESYKNTFQDDHITLLDSNSGNEIYSKSVVEILLENGFEDLLLSKGQIISDQIHLNDIQPALEDGDFWQKGDLLVSCRNISTVFLFRPSTNEILWLKHGPWYNQHDADFYDNSKIVVFGNDVIREESKIDPRITNVNLSFSEKRPFNEVYLYDFEKDSISTPYHKLMQSEEIQTVTSGRCDILESGELFIEESNQGRIIIGDTNKKNIEYVKRINENYISHLFWSRIIK
ncbi:MAG: arylsulfotransferase family protein [Bacteroidia bacterium]|nr:arylsulfotransferase family protein [Bacteroidia bacterium]NNK27930.1 hypothetical protein [Flavobacteriaceae bacterium]